MKKTLVILYTLFFSYSSFSAELFVVHTHKFYLKFNYSKNWKQNPLVTELNKVNEHFCNRNENIYWVWNPFWLRQSLSEPRTLEKKFPLRKCGAQKLKSKWGDLTERHEFKISNDIVIMGLYIGHCVSKTLNSIVKRFLRSNNKEINIHIPMSATLGIFGKNFTESSLKKIITSPLFMNKHNLNNRNFELRLFVNGQFVESKLATTDENNEKKLSITLWGDTDLMLVNF